MRPEMRPRRFTKEEAASLLGRHIRSIIAFSDVPKGATGRVTKIDEIEPNGYELIVEWDLPGRGPVQHDWFTKEEFERSFVEE